MSEKVMELDGSSPELYEPGLLCAHSSSGDGIADVGVSVGLGHGLMLFVGEVPGKLGASLVVYGKNDKIELAEAVDFGDLSEKIGHLAKVISEALKND